MTAFGIPHRHVAQCGSTNDLAGAWAYAPNDPAPSGALVTADFQTQGRGQRGRQWQAGFGQSALMSFVYHIPPEAIANQLGLVAALAVTDAIISVSNLLPRIKWPNDVLLDKCKVAGILVEIAPRVPNSCRAVLGIGINVNQERFAGAEGFVFPPTSLRLVTGRVIEVERMISAVAQALTQREAQWRQEGFPPIVEECRRLLALGVTVRRGEQQAELVGLAPTGAAKVRVPDGTFAHWSTVD